MTTGPGRPENAAERLSARRADRGAPGRTLRRILGRASGLSRHEVRLLAAALAEVVRARAGLALHRHDALRARIASLAAQTVPAPAAPAALAEVSWSVTAAARVLPGATCLTQALAGQALLARRGIGSTVELSLPEAAERFRPHAWLIAADRVVLGGTAVDHACHRRLAAFPAGGTRE